MQKIRVLSNLSNHNTNNREKMQIPSLLCLFGKLSKIFLTSHEFLSYCILLFSSFCLNSTKLAISLKFSFTC